MSIFKFGQRRVTDPLAQQNFEQLEGFLREARAGLAYQDSGGNLSISALGGGQVVSGTPVTITCTGRPVLLGFNCVFGNASGATQNPAFQFRRDGDNVGALGGGLIPNGEYGQVSGTTLDVSPTPGEHTYAMYNQQGGDGSGSTWLYRIPGFIAITFYAVEL